MISPEYRRMALEAIKRNDIALYALQKNFSRISHIPDMNEDEICDLGGTHAFLAYKYQVSFRQANYCKNLLYRRNPIVSINAKLKEIDLATLVGDTTRGEFIDVKSGLIDEAESIGFNNLKRKTDLLAFASSLPDFGKPYVLPANPWEDQETLKSYEIVNRLKNGLDHI